MHERAATPVLGIVMMVGFTIAAALALFATGSVVIQDSQSTVQADQAQESMEDVAKNVDRTIAGPQKEGDFSFQGAGDSSPQVEANTGTVRVKHNGSTLYDEPVGALVYENQGTTFAYQGGAVWRLDENGDARMLRSPQVHYNFRTLTLPLINITGDVTAGSQTGSIHLGETNRIYPNGSEPNPLEGGTVLFEVESADYCTGWQQYFDSQTEGELEERCNEGTQDKVAVEFSVPFEIDGLESGIVTEDGTATGIDNDNVTEADEISSASPLVESKLEEAETAERVPSGIDGGTLDGPTGGNDTKLYYADGNLHDNDITFNTTNGDIEVAANQSDILSGQEEFTITGDGTVTIFANGTMITAGGGSGDLGNEGDEDQFRMFVHSSVDEIGASGQNTDVHGLIYAPNTDVDLGTGGHDLSGAIVGDDLDIGNAGFDVDDDLKNLELEYNTGGEPFYFLHIVETEIKFKG